MAWQTEIKWMNDWMNEWMNEWISLRVCTQVMLLKRSIQLVGNLLGACQPTHEIRCVVWAKDESPVNSMRAQKQEIPCYLDTYLTRSKAFWWSTGKWKIHQSTAANENVDSSCSEAQLKYRADILLIITSNLFHVACLCRPIVFGSVFWRDLRNFQMKNKCRKSCELNKNEGAFV